MKQYDIVVVNLDPTVGSEIKKTRPSIVISPNEMNDSLKTVIIAPVTSNKKKYPTRVTLDYPSVRGMIALEQIRTIDKKRIISTLGQISTKTNLKIKEVLNEMFIK